MKSLPKVLHHSWKERLFCLESRGRAFARRQHLLRTGEALNGVESDAFVRPRADILLDTLQVKEVDARQNPPLRAERGIEYADARCLAQLCGRR
jgi:hypothetical protein